MKNDEYILTVGLEVHAELATKSKMWCGCKNDPDEEKPNQNICPICMAHPGTLPVINREAVRQVLRVGTALGGTLADFTEFDRKNYFYPDIPKGYQLSQYKYPLVTGGSLQGVQLTRIHLEEDTGTSIHKGTHSLVDYNRAGVPLMELVTEPVIHDAITASNFARELQLVLQYLGAGEANMEKGEMRIEANISVARRRLDSQGDALPLGTKVEVKNINSFKAVEKAIEYERQRHIELLERGEEVKQETRGWDEKKLITFSQRSKENAHDYRYFPDPDLPKLKLADIPEFAVEALQTTLPELPWQKRGRLTEFGLGRDQIEFFVSDTKSADYFDLISKALDNKVELIRLAANYVTADLAGLSEKESFEIFPKPEYIAELVTMISENKISSRGAKDMLAQMVLSNNIDKNPSALAEELGVLQVSDTRALEEMVNKIIAENPTAVAEYKAGKVASLQFLLGQAMKVSKGSANPQMLRDLFLKILS